MRRFIDKYFLPLFLLTGIVLLGSAAKLGFVGDNLNQIFNIEKDFFSLSYGYLRPVFGFTLFINKLISGTSPLGYHLFNILLHLVNSYLVYHLLQALFPESNFNLWLSFLFMILPIHAMNVFWISGRTDIICAFFYLLSTLYFIRFTHLKQNKFLLVSLLAFLLSLLSKEMAISLPFILSSYILTHAPQKQRMHLGKSILPFYLILFIYISIRFLVLNAQSLSNEFHSNYHILALIKNLSAYIGLLMLPGGHLELGIFLLTHPLIFIPLAFLTIVGFIFMFFHFRTNPVFVFSSISLIISLLPVIRLMMRWYLYIPSIFYILLIASIIVYSGKFSRIKFYLLIFYILLSGIFLRLELENWQQSTVLARKFRKQISKKILHQQTRNVNVLFNISEFRETPVLIFGLETSTNFEIFKHLDSLENYKINNLVNLSIYDLEDLSKIYGHQLDSIHFTVSARRSGSAYFDFPKVGKLVSGRYKLRPGDTLNTHVAQYRICSVNKRHQADSMLITVQNNYLTILPELKDLK